MYGPDITTMTDEQIGALSDDELEEALSGDPIDEGADDDNDEPDAGDDDTHGDEGDDGEGEGDEDEGDDEGDGGADTTDAEREAERLRRLAKDDDGKVPRARLNEVIRERDQYRDLALEALRSGKTPQQEPAATPKEEPKRPEYDLKAGMREYHKLLNEGEEDKAIAKLEEVEEARAAIAQYDLDKAAREAEERAYARVAKDTAEERMAGALNEAYEAYPFLNHESKHADPDAIAAVNVRAKQLVAEGRPPHIAIKLASKRVGDRFAKLLGLDTGKPSGTPAEDAATKAGKDRAQNAVRRGLDVRQPSTQKMGVGTRDGGAKIDISKLTDKQIDALSQAELNEALGIE